MGIFSLQNFWFILHTTWLLQIQTNYNSSNKSTYLKHITTANNQDHTNINITTPQQQTVFFITLSLVFNITLQINVISNTSHTTSIINASNITNFTKILNFRQSISRAVVEPWINPAILLQPKV